LNLKAGEELQFMFPSFSAAPIRFAHPDHSFIDQILRILIKTLLSLDLKGLFRPRPKHKKFFSIVKYYYISMLKI